MVTKVPRGNSFALVVAFALLVAAVVGPAVDAQKPERKQEVKVPGLDVPLKAGWQLLFYKGCRFAVPVSWHTNVDASLVLAPDGSNVSVRMFKVASWSTHKAQIKAAFGRVDVVNEDSERRLWFEIGDKGRVQHYIDVPNGLTVCSALLEIRAATTPDAEDTTRRIADSLGPAPEKWPPGAIK